MIKIINVKKGITTRLGFQKYMPKVLFTENTYLIQPAKRLIPFLQLLKRTKIKLKITLTSEPLTDCSENNGVLNKRYQLALREPLPDKQSQGPMQFSNRLYLQN